MLTVKVNKADNIPIKILLFKRKIGMFKNEHTYFNILGVTLTVG